MSLQNILYGVIGLLVGLIVGFMFANSMNRSVAVTAQSSSALPGAANPGLPPNHPPVGNTSEGMSGSGAMPDITAAIDKARQQPQDFEAQMTAADLYYQIQRFDEAAKFYEAAAKVKPKEVEPMIKAGDANFEAGKYEVAEVWYTKALEHDPKNLAVRTDLGLTFYLRSPRDLDRAIKEYKAVLAIKPDHEITLQNLALAYRERGDQAEFKATTEQLRKTNPDNPALKNLTPAQ